MDYQIDFIPSALEQLRGLPKEARRLIGAKLDRAQHDLSGDIKKLKGFKNKYRLRAGTFMSNSASTSAKTPGNWTQLNKQLAQAKALLRQMSQTVEDIEDARTIERAKRANAGKPRVSWAQAKRELQLD